MKCLAINFPVHIWISEENLCRATLGYYRQHPRIFKVFYRLGRKDHRRSVLAPSFLRLHDVIADGLVLDEEPCLIEEEDLESRELLGISDLVRCPMQDVEQ